MKNAPHNEKIEKELLVCINYDHTILDDIVVEPEDMYVPRYKEILRTMQSLHRSGSAVDVTMIQTELANRRMLNKVGGLDELLFLSDSLPNIHNAETYARTVRQLSVRRRVIDECRSCIHTIGDVENPFEESLTAVSTRIASAVDTTVTADNCVSAHEALVSAVGHVRDVHSGKENSNALYTGLVDLDNKLCGLWPGEVVVVAGRPGMGKSALALSILKNSAMTGKVSILFTLEMSQYLVSLRLLSEETDIPSGKIRTGMIGEYNFDRLDGATMKYKDVPLFIDDTALLRPDRIYSICRQKQKRYGAIGAIAVDYLQLMKATGNKGNREQEVAELSRTMKIISKDFHCPVLPLSQLNRVVEYRKDNRPTMSDLRESGAIEQDADTILFVYRDEVYHNDTTEPGIAEIIIGKARSGSTGTVKVRFVKEFTRFQNLETRNYDRWND